MDSGEIVIDRMNCHHRNVVLMSLAIFGAYSFCSYSLSKLSEIVNGLLASRDSNIAFHSRSLSTFVPFSIRGSNRRVLVSRLRGRAVRRASHDQPVWGAFVLREELALQPVSCIRRQQPISPSHHAPVIFVSSSTTYADLIVMTVGIDAWPGELVRANSSEKSF
jgi:hypothetical protein